ncbi:MAG TPA: histidine kinase [Candidatus Binatia bacterium]|nr:histidine kinase [Candidatus Binatia bacterium]
MALTDRWLAVGRALLTALPLIFLAGVTDLLGHGSTAERALVGVAIAAGIPTWVWFWWVAIDTRRSLLAPLAALLIVLILVALDAVAAAGQDALLLGALAVGAALPLRRAVPVVLGVSLIAVAIQFIHHASVLVAASVLVDDLVLGAVAGGGRLLILTNRDLVAARDEIARLAVSEERLRFARDLHDLVGQNLTLAILDAELVGRDLPAAAPADLRTTLSELERTIRQALGDIRTAVAGYREPTIASELDAARALLAATGIDLTVESRLDSLSPVEEGVLAWALREGVTNVARHSQAAHCLVRLNREAERTVLEIQDDGRGFDGLGTGTGLAGVRERLAAIGGTLEATALEGRGYRLRASLPTAAR